MNASDLIYKIVAISIALVVVSMILIPMVTAATENEITVTQTGTNDATSTFGFDASNITLSYDTDTWAFDSAHAGVGNIVTSAAVIILNNNTVTVNGDPVDPTVEDSIVITGNVINTYLTGNGDPVKTYNLTAIAGGNYVLTDAAADQTYGVWGQGHTPLINKNVNLIAINLGTPVLEKYNGTSATGSVSITATASEDYPGAYEVTSVGTGGLLVAPLEYTYNAPVEMDDNIKTIIGIVPYLVIIGILLAACYLFVSGRY